MEKKKKKEKHPTEDIYIFLCVLNLKLDLGGKRIAATDERMNNEEEKNILKESQYKYGIGTFYLVL